MRGQAKLSTASSVGRPKAITERDVRKLSELLKVGHSVAMACTISGIPRSTYYDELARNEEFSDRMQAAQEVLTYRATQIVAMSIGGGNLKTAKWWLDRQDRREYQAQRASEYRRIKRVTVTEMQQQSRSVSLEVDQ